MKRRVLRAAFSLVAASLLGIPANQAAGAGGAPAAPLSNRDLVVTAASLFDPSYSTELETRPPSGEWTIAVIDPPVSQSMSPDKVDGSDSDLKNYLFFVTGTVAQTTKTADPSPGPLNGYSYYAWMVDNDIGLRIVGPRTKFVQMDVSDRRLLIAAGSERGYLDPKAPGIYAEAVSGGRTTENEDLPPEKDIGWAGRCVLDVPPSMSQTLDPFGALDPYGSPQFLPRMALGAEYVLIIGSRQTHVTSPPRLRECKRDEPYLDKVGVTEVTRRIRDMFAPMRSQALAEVTRPAPDHAVADNRTHISDFLKERHERFGKLFSSLQKAKRPKIVNDGQLAPVMRAPS